MIARRLSLVALLLCAVAGSALWASAARAVAPPTIEEEYAVNVSASSATLRGELNPQGGDTTYRFEYGPSAAYGVGTATVDAGTASQLVQAHLQELSPHTTFHYRLVATNGAGTTDGVDRTFTTQTLGASLTLLDGRQWEKVSPAVKYGAGIELPNAEGGTIEAAEDGNGISYLATDAIEASPQGNRALELAQILARRAPGGWDNQTIDTPNEDIHGLAVGLGPEYRMFTPDLTRDVIEPRSLTRLTPSATERTPYLRDQAACEAHSSGCYTALVTPEDTMPGAIWDPHPNYVYSEEKFVTATSDFNHVIIRSDVPLTADAGEKGLYEWSAGRLQFVSVLPESEGGAAVDGELGAGKQNARGALSRDGSRIVWSGAGGGLYLTDTQRRETIRLDTPGGEHLVFQIANADDSRVFFSEESSPEPRILYECEIVEIAGKLTCDRREIASGLWGNVLGASEDGSSVYFVASSALAGAATPANCYEGPTCNLYMEQLKGGERSIHFIGALASGFGTEGDSLDWAETISDQTARVSRDGRFLAFMSSRSLTGYDNHDVISGQADEEAYLYDAAQQRLMCASCNPTGARPQGVFYSGSTAPLMDPIHSWSERWVAATLPPWRSKAIQVAIYQPRYLSDSGRLFFNSSDALLPQDTNGLSDVYEYEPDGVGSCAEGEGCVDLISSGASGEEAGFLDASATGDDAFFITSARLTQGDEDTAFDLYDAHVCTASVPCTQQASTPPPCGSGDACKAPPTPQPTSFGAPASATFSGHGNTVATAPASVQRRSAPTRTQKLSRALELCRRRHAHHRRKLAACERRARGLYGKAAHGGHNGRGH